uniref:M15 family peptidase n=1 Tax=Nocardioides sp. TaxID=35761 RepID=UPI002B26F4F4
MRRARMTAAVLGAAMLLPTACGDPGATTSSVSDIEGTEGTEGAGGTPTESASVAPVEAVTTELPADPGTAIDPSYAMDAPGPRKEAIVPADILIQDTSPLSDDVVQQVLDLDGVRAALRLSVSQVLLENKAYTIAAVDPGQYRSYTVLASADLQEQWDRVAGGEVAASPALRKQLPVDDGGFLDLGEDSPSLHVGAWAPQVEGIDLVVNAKVGEALGMPQGNAVVLSTGEVAPQTLRKPLAAVVGEEISVQNLDVVSRLGLDPEAFQSAVLFGSFADAVGVFRYTSIGGGRIAPEPSWVSQHISTEVVPILGSVTCNKALMPQLKAALAEIVSQGLESEIKPDEYAGCYYPRFIA